VWGGLALSDGRLFLGTDAGAVIALETKSGRELWRFATNGAVRSRPEPVADELVVASDDGHAYRLAASDGKVLWKARLGEAATRSKVGDPAYAYDSYASSPTVSGSTLYIGNGADLVALEAASGKELWRYTTGGGISTKPAIAEGLAFVGSFDGKLHALDAGSGKLAWSHDFGAPVTSSPAFSDGRLIVGSRSYDLKALRARSGEVDWRYYYWFSWVESSPSIVDRTAYVGSSDGQKLHAFDMRSGKRSWSLDTGGSAWAQPAVSGGRVFIGSVGVDDYLVDHRATFWGIDRESGSPTWRFDLPRPEGSTLWGFASSPAADKTAVYAATLDGRVFAFAR
jgi:outer membrane protein assembly factor BamB